MIKLFVSPSSSSNNMMNQTQQNIPVHFDVVPYIPMSSSISHRPISSNIFLPPSPPSFCLSLPASLRTTINVAYQSGGLIPQPKLKNNPLPMPIRVPSTDARPVCMNKHQRVLRRRTAVQAKEDPKTKRHILPTKTEHYFVLVVMLALQSSPPTTLAKYKLLLYIYLPTGSLVNHTTALRGILLKPELTVPGLVGRTRGRH